MRLTRRAFFPTFSFAGFASVAEATDAKSEVPFPDDICSSDPGQPAVAGVDPKAYSSFTSGMRVGMDKMMRDMDKDPPSGDPDLDFLAMMIPHHWGATEMARLVLLHGRDPIVREIAEKILATQVTEMDGMRGRLAALRTNEENYPSLTGNRG